jgi:hypothetical protein
VTVLPDGIRADLHRHLDEVRQLHEADLSAGEGRVPLPDALDRKYPGAGATWPWQFVFPARRICKDSRWGPPSRFHLHESAVQRAVTVAVRRRSWRNAPLVIRSGTRLLRTSWRTAMTSAPCRSCWAMPTSVRR